MNNEIDMDKVLSEIREAIEGDSWVDAARIMLETGEDREVKSEQLKDIWSEGICGMECEVEQSLTLVLGGKKVLEGNVWGTFHYFSDKINIWKVKDGSIDYDDNGFLIDKL